MAMLNNQMVYIYSLTMLNYPDMGTWEHMYTERERESFN